MVRMLTRNLTKQSGNFHYLVIEMLFGVLFGGKGWMWKTAGGFGGDGPVKIYAQIGLQAPAE